VPVAMARDEGTALGAISIMRATQGHSIILFLTYRPVSLLLLLLLLLLLPVELVGGPLCFRGKHMRR